MSDTERVAELQRNNAELRRFVHLASHDLQAPLRTLSGYSDLLERHLKDNCDEETRRLLGELRGGSRRLSRLLGELLDYVLMGDTSTRAQPVQMAHCLGRARADLAEEERQARATVERSELPWVSGEPKALTMLWRALLSNALKFRRGSHPHIEIGCAEGPERHLFWIRDDGIGIPPRYQTEVFQPFRRLHTLEEYPGQGLGLALAHRILSRLGGSIWIESNAGFGITVFFEMSRGGTAR